MICPKCRTKYPEGVTVCPDCGVELFGLLGSADAQDDGLDNTKSKWKADEDFPPIPKTVELYTDRTAGDFEEEEPVFDGPDEDIIDEFDEPKKDFREVVVDESDEFSPVVYKKRASSAAAVKGKAPNALGVFFLILSLLFAAASIVMFSMGKKAQPDSEAAAVAAFISGLFPF